MKPLNQNEIYYVTGGGVSCYCTGHGKDATIRTAPACKTFCCNNLGASGWTFYEGDLKYSGRC